MKKSAYLFALLAAMAITACGGSNESSEESKVESSESIIESISSEGTSEITSSSEFISITSSEDSEESIVESSEESSEVESSEESIESSSEIQKEDFAGLSFEDDELVYDGGAHTIEVSGLPEGAEAHYTNEGPFTNVGVYEIHVVVSKEGYNDWEGDATLTITKATMEGVVFDDLLVKKDGQPHTIEASGYPDGSKVTYEGNGPFDSEGVYHMTVKIENPNYEDYEDEATLTIYAASTTAGIIADFEEQGDSDLGSEWKREYYNENTWAASSGMTVNVSNDVPTASSTQSMRVKTFRNGYTFKATKHIEEKKLLTYESISLDIRRDSSYENNTVQLQYWVENMPVPQGFEQYANTYVTYTLSTDLSANWTHYDVRFDDAGWTLAGQTQIPLATALQYIGITPERLPMYISDVALIFKGSSIDNGPSTYTVVDNIAFTNAEQTGSKTLVNLKGNRYSGAVNDVVFVLDIKDDENAHFATKNLPSNFEGDATYAVNGDQITLTSKGADGLVYVGKIKDNGGSISFVSANANVPQIAEMVNGLNFGKVIVVDNFESYEATGVGYDGNNPDPDARSGLRAAYFADYWTGGNSNPSPISPTDWSRPTSTDYLNLVTEGAHSGTKAAKFKGSTNQMRYVTYGLSDGTAQPIGKGSTFSFFAKATVETTMNVRVFYENSINVNNQSATSSSCAYYSFPSIGTDDYKQYTVTLDPTRTVYGVDIRPGKLASYITIDDMEIFQDTNPWATYKAPETLNDGSYYLVAGGEAYVVELSNEGTTAVFKAVLSEQSIDLTATVANDQVVFKDLTGGAMATVTCDIADGKFTVKSVTGMAATMLNPLVNGVFKPYQSVSLDFQDLTAGGALNDANWKQEYYPSNGWVSTSGKMNVRNSGDNKFINMYSGYNTSYKYTYKPGDKNIGPVNFVSFDWANDFTGAETIKVKVYLTTLAGSTYYISGNADTYTELPANVATRSNFMTASFQLDQIVEAQSITVLVRSPKNGDAYLYVDNIKACCQAPAAPQYLEAQDGNYYLYIADSALFVELKDNVSSANMGFLGNASMQFACTVSETNGHLVLKDSGMAGAMITAEFDVVEGGLKVTSVSGGAASSLAAIAGQTFVPFAPLVLDAQQYDSQVPLTDTHWKQQKYTSSGWTDLSSSQIRIKTSGSNKYFNMYSGYQTDYMYTYKPDLPMGPVNHVSLDYANDYTKAAIKIKVIGIKKDGSSLYMNTTDGSYTTISDGDGAQSNMTHVEFSFAATELIGVKFVIRDTKGGDSYFYMDNIAYSYVAA